MIDRAARTDRLRRVRGRSDHCTGARIVQHRRRLASRDRRMEQPVSLRDHEPARIWRDRRAPHRKRSFHRARGRDAGGGHSHGPAAASIWSVIPLAAWSRSRWRCATVYRLASLVIVEAPAVRAAARQRRSSSTIARSAQMSRGLFRRLRGRQHGSDRDHDRLLRRRRHLRLLAAAGSRLRRGDDAGQYPRLGERGWFRHLSAASLAAHRNSRRWSFVGGASHPAMQRANAAP